MDSETKLSFKNWYGLLALPYTESRVEESDLNRSDYNKYVFLQSSSRRQESVDQLSATLHSLHVESSFIHIKHAFFYGPSHILWLWIIPIDI